MQANFNNLSINRINKRNYYWPYIFLAPYFIMYFLFGLFPILFSLVISFTSWDGIGEIKFVGFKNYIQLFTSDPYFLKSIYNTILLMLGYIPLLITVGLLLAAGLHGQYIKFKRFFQLANFMPYITTPVAIGLMFALMFDYRTGMINRIITYFGLYDQNIYWLGKPVYARVVVILMVFWKYAGYHMVIYMAGLANIPVELYEAAKVDGASAIQTFFKITVPSLKSVIMFLLITDIIGGFQLVEEPMLLFTGMSDTIGQVGGPERSCLTAIWNLYDTAFGSSMRYGLGASIAYGTFMFIMLFSILGFKIFKPKDGLV